MTTAAVIAAIDSGTTNTRVRLLRDGQIVGGASAQVGVVDTAKTGSNATLKRGIRDAFEVALEGTHLTLADVSYALGAGMVTSELGVIELPHLTAPVGLRDLAAGMARVEPTADFLPIPTYFIRGIKNRVEPGAGISALPRMDFMRGEEAQVMGLLALHRPALPTTIVILSSHTKFISVDAEGRIQGSVTTLSGQLFAAICKETFVASAVREASQDPEPAGFFDAGIVEEGWRIVTGGGLTRALLMTRFMQVLMQTRWYERKLFLESLIAGEDLRSLRDMQGCGLSTRTPVWLVGAPERVAVYRHLIERRGLFAGPVHAISDAEAIERLGPIGASTIFQACGVMPTEVS